MYKIEFENDMNQIQEDDDEAFVYDDTEEVEDEQEEGMHSLKTAKELIDSTIKDIKLQSVQPKQSRKFVIKRKTKQDVEKDN